MEPAASAARITRWLLEQGRLFDAMPALQVALLEQVRAHIPVDRLWCGTTVLHPQAAAYVWITEAGGATIAHELSYDRFARLESLDSPVRRLKLGAPTVRFDCASPAPGDPPDVADLGSRGYTDLYGASLRFRGAWVGGVTWASRAPGGFTEAQIAVLDGILPTLTAVVEPLARDLVFATLMRTYLGSDAGDRVSAGQVRRGDVRSLRAAVWFSDVRGFTQLSAALPRAALLELLNEVFEAVVDGIRPHGGQVLKFIGDGSLAVFEAGEGPEAATDACARATRAAVEVQQRLAALREARRSAGGAEAHVGIGLHFGEVSYGNIGAPARLDFTVIGPAVNLAARVEGLCASTGREILATAELADRVDGWEPLGAFALKGVGGEVPVFAQKIR